MYYPLFPLLFKEDSNIASYYKNSYKKTHGRHESQCKVNPINCVVFQQPNPTSTCNYIAAWCIAYPIYWNGSKINAMFNFSLSQITIGSLTQAHTSIYWCICGIQVFLTIKLQKEVIWITKMGNNPVSREISFGNFQVKKTKSILKERERERERVMPLLTTLTKQLNWT